MASMHLVTESYILQTQRWPKDGKHILAHYDDHSVVVYQAYKPEIADYAVAHGRLGGPYFSFNRMSWIKPNFLWMMYRCGWGSKVDQQRTLGLRIPRALFDRFLEDAVASSFDADRYDNHDGWKEAVERSDVRLQWDPDHDPRGVKVERRAVQIGLRDQALRTFIAETQEVIDMSAFVAAQAPLASRGDAGLMTPLERVYAPTSAKARQNVGIDT